jgi:hypothetical protein
MKVEVVVLGPAPDWDLVGNVHVPQWASRPHIPIPVVRGQHVHLDVTAIREFRLAGMGCRSGQGDRQGNNNDAPQRANARPG